MLASSNCGGNISIRSSKKRLVVNYGFISISKKEKRKKKNEERKVNKKKKVMVLLLSCYLKLLFTVCETVQVAIKSAV
jgi:hypothetical protein